MGTRSPHQDRRALQKRVGTLYLVLVSLLAGVLTLAGATHQGGVSLARVGAATALCAAFLGACVLVLLRTSTTPGE